VTVGHNPLVPTFFFSFTPSIETTRAQLPKTPYPLPSKKKKKIPKLQKTYNRIMLDNKRRIRERKSQICLFHYPHDKVPPPQKKDGFKDKTKDAHHHLLPAGSEALNNLQ
jgi:hypothetical protein